MELEGHMAININSNKFSSFEPHQILQAWFSSSFPIGSYVYSHGLEAMIENKLVTNKKDVIDFIESTLFVGTCRNEYIFLKSTYNGTDVNDLVLANCPSKERHIETLQMGDAFRKIMKESWNFNIDKKTSFPVCVAKAGLRFNIPFRELSDFYMQSFITNLINVCVKHVPLSQKDGQDCLLAFLGMLKEFNVTAHKYNLDDLSGLSFYGDIYSMKHEKLSSRVYVT
jgi:urease accessory protein